MTCAIAGVPASNAATATILGEIGDQTVHRGEVGGVKQLPADAALRHQPGMGELLQMKGQRRRQDAERAGNASRRQTVRPALHQQTERFEPRVVRERAKRGNGFLGLHGNLPIFRR